MKYLILLLFILSLIITGCDGDSDSEEDKNELLQTGIASWYGPGFHGRLTSSRERYNQNDLTAAHRTIPFNTVIQVKNLENDKSVEVRINDRGPYQGDRIIDLSKAAAEKIDIIDPGISEVELILIKPGGPIPEDLNQPTYTIQLGEYYRLPPAERFAKSLGDGVRIEQRFSTGRDSSIAYMIYYGNFDSISSAKIQLNKLNQQDYEGLVKQIN